MRVPRVKVASVRRRDFNLQTCKSKRDYGRDWEATLTETKSSKSFIKIVAERSGSGIETGNVKDNKL